MSLTWKVLPSSILHIDDPYTAYCLDEAVFVHCCLIQQENEEAPETLSISDLAAMRGMGGIEFNAG